LPTHREWRRTQTEISISIGIEEDVVRIHQRDNHEERLLGGCLWGEISERALPAGVPLAVIIHEPAVVVGVAAASLVDVLVGAGVLGVPALKAVLTYIPGDPVLAVRFAAMPLAFIDNVVTDSGHHAGDVLEVERKLNLGVLPSGHVFFQRVLDAMLGREIAGHPGGACRRTHAGVGEGALKG
jgi:hypothetical protein